MFQADPNYEQTEAEWDEIKKEILGEEADRMAQGAGLVGEPESEDEEEEKNANQNVRLNHHIIPYL